MELSLVACERGIESVGVRSPLYDLSFYIYIYIYSEQNFEMLVIFRHFSHLFRCAACMHTRAHIYMYVSIILSYMLPFKFTQFIQIKSELSKLLRFLFSLLTASLPIKLLRSLLIWKVTSLQLYCSFKHL